MGRSDLKSATGRYEADSLIETRVVGHDLDEQLTTLAFEGGKLIVPKYDGAIGDRVRTRIRARDVSLARRKPTEISILNVLPGRVSSIGIQNGSTVDVHLALGTASITARITHRSLRELQIEVGHELYALVKAVSFDQPGAEWV